MEPNRKIVAAWIKEALDYATMNQKDLANELGTSDSVVSSMVSPSSTRQFKIEEINKISEITKYPTTRLFISPSHGSTVARRQLERSLRDAGYVSTVDDYQSKLPGASPDIDTSAGAGPGGLSLPEQTDGGIAYQADAVRGEIVLPDYLLMEFTRAKPGRVHWIRVRGDSMAETLEPGDRVGVDTTDTAIGQGGVFVIRDADGEILVKRLRKQAGEGRIEIVSDNPKQGNSVVSAEEISIIGRVVARITRVG